MAANSKQKISTRTNFSSHFKQYLKTVAWYEYCYLIAVIITSVILLAINIPSNLQIIVLITSLSSSMMAIFKKPTCFIYGFLHAIVYAVVCFFGKIYSSFIIFGLIMSTCEALGLFLGVKYLDDDGQLKTKQFNLRQNLIVLFAAIVGVLAVMVLLQAIEGGGLHAFLDAISSITLAVGMILMLCRYREQGYYGFPGDFLTLVLGIYLFIMGNHDIIMLVQTSGMAFLSLTGLIRWAISPKKR